MMPESSIPLSQWSSSSHEANNPFLLRFLFGLFISLVVLRFLVTNPLLNTISSYTTEGGSAVEKLHFTTYGLVVISILSLLSLRIELSQWELGALKALIQLIAVVGFIALVMILSGNTTSAGYLIDSYIAACVFSMMMFVFPPEWREMLGSGLILFVLASALIGVAEFVLGVRLMPYPRVEEVFRPTGLTGHPLQLGLYAATAIAFVPLTRWPALVKAGAIAILLVCTFAAGARFASLVASGCTLLLILFARSRLVGQTGTQIKVLIAIAIVLIVPLLVLALASTGFLERFERSGLFDTSAMARISVYSVFGMVEWRDILLGTDILKIQRLATERLGLDYIESSLIFFVFQYGLIGAVVFAIVLARTFISLLKQADWRAVLGTCVFFVAALTNNTLSSKAPDFLLISLFVIAFHRR